MKGEIFTEDKTLFSNKFQIFNRIAACIVTWTAETDNP